MPQLLHTCVEHDMPETGQQSRHLSVRSATSRGPVKRAGYSEPAGYDSNTPPCDSATPAESQAPSTVMTSHLRKVQHGKGPAYFMTGRPRGTPQSGRLSVKSITLREILQFAHLISNYTSSVPFGYSLHSENTR